MGVTLKRRPGRDRGARRGKDEQRGSDELDELIDYGRRALTAPGSAPLAMQLDTALRLAGLHLRRAERPDRDEATRADDVRWAATLASIVADRTTDTPPAAVVDLGTRAVAVLDLCVPNLPPADAASTRELAQRTRDRVARSEEVCALSLDDAIASLTIAQSLVQHAPDGPDREPVLARARSLLATSAIAARRAGYAPVADAAIALIEQISEQPPAAPRSRRGLRRFRR